MLRCRGRRVRGSGRSEDFAACREYVAELAANVLGKSGHGTASDIEEEGAAGALQRLAGGGALRLALVLEHTEEQLGRLTGIDSSDGSQGGATRGGIGALAEDPGEGIEGVGETEGLERAVGTGPDIGAGVGCGRCYGVGSGQVA